MTRFVEEYQTLFFIGTIGILAWAFYLTYRPRSVTSGRRSKIMALNKVMLWAATGMVIVFFFAPQSVSNLFASSDGFTKDMVRTEIAIEGMT